MATLAVRPLRLRDLAYIPGVNQIVDRLDGPLHQFRASSTVGSRLQSAIPGRSHGDRAFVATIDGELCAYLIAHREQRDFQWQLAEIAAGSPRLHATHSVSVELWSALISFVVSQAGATGAKRVFASAEDGSAAYESLRANSFEAFENRFVLTRQGAWHNDLELLPHVRQQQNSDVWSVHQLYHLVTPRGVQFAEALTSSEWEQVRDSWFNRVVMGGRQESSFVLDTGEGVSGHCRIERRNGCAIARVMMSPNAAQRLDAFLYTCASMAGVGKNDRLQVDVPGYFLEHTSVLERAGFSVSWERSGLVKHTTASVVVRPNLVPVPTPEERERAVHGVPTLYQ
jgi:hypothetical protein